MILRRLVQARGTQKRARQAGCPHLMAGSEVGYPAPELKR